MIKIGMDRVIYEYVVMMIGATFHGKERFFNSDADPDDSLKEELWVATLKSAVVFGAATYRYQADNKTHEFRSTETLVRNWNWVFPGATLIVNREEGMLLEVAGRRSRFFKRNWLQAERDESNPPPAWPS
jgi:hypothetical protein